MASTYLNSITLIDLLTYYEEHVFLNYKDKVGKYENNKIELVESRTINININKAKNAYNRKRINNIPIDAKLSIEDIGHLAFKEEKIRLDEYILKIAYFLKENESLTNNHDSDYKTICIRLKHFFEDVYGEALPFYDIDQQDELIVKEELYTVASNLINIFKQSKLKEKKPSEKTQKYYIPPSCINENSIRPSTYFDFKILISREKTKLEKICNHLFQSEILIFIEGTSRLLRANLQQQISMSPLESNEYIYLNAADTSRIIDTSGNKYIPFFDNYNRIINKFRKNIKQDLVDFFEELKKSVDDSSCTVINFPKHEKTFFNSDDYEMAILAFISYLALNKRKEANNLIVDFEKYSEILIRFDEKFFNVDNVCNEQCVPWHLLNIVFGYAKFVFRVLHIMRNIKSVLCKNEQDNYIQSQIY